MTLVKRFIGVSSLKQVEDSDEADLGLVRVLTPLLKD